MAEPTTRPNAAGEKPRVRVQAVTQHVGPARKAHIPVQVFDAGKSGRRLRALPTAVQSINTQIRTYGKTVLARARYLCDNNPYAAAAREAFVGALVGTGIKPSSLIDDPELRERVQMAFEDWSMECDADGQTDFYGLQTILAREIWGGGECFVRFRPRDPRDGLSVPLQLQLLPAEMLPWHKQETRGSGRIIRQGIEFDQLGRRQAYHFLRRHPDEAGLVSMGVNDSFSAFETVAVPAEQVLHVYRVLTPGQIRGVTHTLSAITKCALLDQYDDAELDRKKTAALFAGFVTQAKPEEGFGGPLATEDGTNPLDDTPLAPLEAGTLQSLQPGEDITFSSPADVGSNYEAFEYRNLTAIAAAFGVPYSEMTSDLRRTSYSSLRAAMVAFRRQITQAQRQILVPRFCMPIWRRWLRAAVAAGAVPINVAEYSGEPLALRRVKFILPKWEWVDPEKDRKAEEIAVANNWKARSDVIEAEGFDPEEVDRRIARDQERAAQLGIARGSTSASSTPPPSDDDATPDDTEDDDEADAENPDDEEDSE